MEAIRLKFMNEKSVRDTIKRLGKIKVYNINLSARVSYITKIVRKFE